MEKSELIHKTLNLHLGEKKRKIAIKWASFNLGLISILFFDIYKTSDYHDELFYWVELSSLIILFISLIKNVFTYFYFTWFTEEIVCTSEEQRILLNLNSSNSFIKVKLQPNEIELKKKEELFENETNIRNLSWQSYAERKLTINIMIAPDNLLYAN